MMKAQLPVACSEDALFCYKYYSQPKLALSGQQPPQSVSPRSALGNLQAFFLSFSGDMAWD